MSFLLNPYRFAAAAGGGGGAPIGNASSMSANWKHPDLTLSNANLTVSRGASPAISIAPVLSIDAKTTGKWYFELTVDSIGSSSAATNIVVGVSHATVSIKPSEPMASGEVGYLDQYSGAVGIICEAGQQGNTLGSDAFGSSWVASDIISVAVDADARTVQFRRNGGSWSSAYSIPGTNPICAMVRIYEVSTQVTLNFGATSFAHSVPSGYLAWEQNANYAARYWRVFCWVGQTSYLNIAEIVMSLTSGGADQTGSGTASGISQILPTYPYANAVDNNTATAWVSNNVSTNGWWMYDFGSGVTKAIKETSITLLNSGNPDGILTGAIQYSHDASIWYPGRAMVNATWSLGQTRTWAVADG